MHSNRQFLVYFKSGAGHRSRWRNLLGIRGNVLRKGNKKTICLKFGHLLTVKLDFWATGALQRLQQMLFIMEVLTSLPNGNLISVLQMFFWEGLDCTLRSFFDIKDNTLLLWKYAWLYIATCSYISKSKPTNIKASFLLFWKKQHQHSAKHLFVFHRTITLCLTFSVHMDYSITFTKTKLERPGWWPAPCPPL